MVTANETILTAVNGKYTLTAVGTNTIVATDTVGNSTTVTITLNENHIFGDGVVTNEPTVIEKGVRTYICSLCGETKTEEIDKLTPAIIKGGNASYQEGSNNGLTFKFNASLADFVSVSVDDKVITAANYTLNEVSTIVTLTADYLATLSVGKHTLEITSSSVTASTEFTIVAKATASGEPNESSTPADIEEPNDSLTPGNAQSPQTGDTSNTFLWIVLLFVSCGMMTALGITKKK